MNNIEKRWNIKADKKSNTLANKISNIDKIQNNKVKNNLNTITDKKLNIVIYKTINFENKL